MEQYIKKSAIVAKIKRRFDEYSNSILKHYDACKEAKAQELCKILTILDTLEVKEVDLKEEIKEEYLKRRCYGGRDNMLVILNEPEFNTIAKYFFELGLSINNPITAADRGTAEEIIINLKRVEQDYHIDLTKEMEWIINQVKKGEEV